MGLSKLNESIESRIRKLYGEIYTLGLVNGYNTGYDDGFSDGYNKAKNEMKSAISDGLRKGSSQCGVILNRYKKL